jgi:hypothetical protein
MHGTIVHDKNLQHAHTHVVNDFQLSADKFVGVDFLRSWFAVSSMQGSLDQVDQPMHVTSTLLLLRGAGRCRCRGYLRLLCVLHTE